MIPNSSKWEPSGSELELRIPNEIVKSIIAYIEDVNIDQLTLISHKLSQLCDREIQMFKLRPIYPSEIDHYFLTKPPSIAKFDIVKLHDTKYDIEGSQLIYEPKGYNHSTMWRTNGNNYPYLRLRI